jgi:hypothetical protein
MRGLFGPLLPLALMYGMLIGAPVAFMFWSHHDVKLLSGDFRSEAEARKWVETQRAAHPCVPNSEDSKVTAAVYGGTFTARFACDTGNAYYRVALAFAVPIIVIFLLGLCVRSMGTTRRRRKD